MVPIHPAPPRGRLESAAMPRFLFPGQAAAAHGITPYNDAHCPEQA